VSSCLHVFIGIIVIDLLPDFGIHPIDAIPLGILTIISSVTDSRSRTTQRHATKASNDPIQGRISPDGAWTSIRA
jgi:hypothetical protein